MPRRIIGTGEKLPVYSYALYSSEPYPIGIVTSRFRTKEECEEALKSADKLGVKLECLPISHPKVQAYYNYVNQVRKRYNLKPINPSGG